MLSNHVERQTLIRDIPRVEALEARNYDWRSFLLRPSLSEV